MRKRNQNYLGKSIRPIVHNGARVVPGTQVINLPEIAPHYTSLLAQVHQPEVVLLEVELHACLYVVPVDGDVVVPVRPALLVPEPGGVHQLVHDNTCQQDTVGY